MAPSKQSELEELERKLYTYRQHHFELSARVHLSHLIFDAGFRRRMNNRKNVLRLESIMKIQGCQRLMRDNHVPVIVPRSDWLRRVSPRHGDGIIPSLDVDLDYRLRAQDHENLIAAARKTLDSDNQWWIVDVYVIDDEGDSCDVDAGVLREKFIQSLNERFPNDNRPPDGLIYERINYYEGHLDGPLDRMAANNWWAVLERVAGSKKGKYLRLFFKHPTLHQNLNSLLVIGGLWEDMRIGLLHKLNSMHCDEPISCYWGLILSTFLGLVGGRRELLPLIDGVTVGLIQSCAPKVSDNDLTFLQTEMDEGNLFANIPEEPRQEIWERLKEIDYPIPTLKTFFKDRLYLEVAQNVMKRLFTQPRDMKITIDEGVCGVYDTAVPILQGQERLRPDLLEFWRFSFQYGFEMTDHRRRKSLKGPDIENPSDQYAFRSLPIDRSDIWRHFFGIMRARGFKPPSTEDLSLPTVELPSPIPCDYPEDPSKEIDVAKRCGKPFTDTMEADRFALSAESLQQNRTMERVTAGFLQRSIFKAFFGYLMESRASSGQSFGYNPFEVSMGTHDYRAQSAHTNLNPDTTEVPDLPEDFTSATQAPLPTPMTEPFTPVVAASAVDVRPSCYIMDVCIAGNTRRLNLPTEQSYMNTFSDGLARNHFDVWIPEDNRYIRPETCYRHYLQHPLSQLHAEFKARESLRMDIGSKRRRVDAQPDMERAREWLENQLSDLSTSDENEL
ncbi:hypothetical protein N7510_002688 [Penicillium lagena]|uniref:uncharacterized protein n=1 Tax=Penicillium lagena TaxID=94218 RepID=UPI002540AB68|nr:uncharacterized protein N7510_002688 [Penicillium lagena]KAJ5626379.1 hypothetical protein N7510_002688 [Penicillium lagena]